MSALTKIKKNHLHLALILIICSTRTIAQSDFEVDDGSSGHLYLAAVSVGTNKPVNTSLPIGRTMGFHSVSPTGAAGYSIPLELPPGTKGIVPDLNLIYNSQGGDGVLGLGWSFSTPSAITRVQKDILHDGQVRPIIWDNTNPIALDGVRLKLMSGSALSSGALYAKEIEDFSKIYVLSFEGETYFEVHRKDGMIYQYGYGPYNRMNHSNGETYTWLLNKVYDLSGNFYSLYYDWVFGEMVISRIEYTGNPYFAPYWRIKFEYNQRNDGNTHFVQGLMIRQEALLRRIIIERISDGTISKKYFLNYTLKNQHSLLREITEIGKNGNALNSTVVKYGDDGTSYFASSNTAEDGDPSTVWFSGDFNGDGMTDLANFYESGVLTDEIRVYNKCNIFVKSPPPSNGFVQFVTNQTLSPAVSIKSDNDLIPGLAFDYNGDGIDDITTMKVQYINGYYRLTAVYIYESPYLNGSLGNPIVVNYSSDNIVYPDDLNSSFIPGDFDGDGRFDYISILAKESGGYEGYITLGGEYTPHEIDKIDNWETWIISARRRIIDLNGDGRSDIFVQGGQYSRTRYFEKESGIWKMKAGYFGGFPTEWHQIYTGDFNGDGRTDLLTHNGSIWEVTKSNGYGWYDPQLFSYNATLNSNEILSNLIIADYNGDGMSDILELEKSSALATTSIISLYQSRGNNFATENLTSSGFYIDNISQHLLGDFNGDGRIDLLYRNGSTQSQDMNLFQYEPHKTNRLAHVIADGFGYDVKFDYRTLSSSNSTNNYDVYEKGALETYPLNKTQFPLNVVWHTTVPDGVGTLGTASDDIQTEYRYSEAIIHRQGRGFLGFKNIRTRNLDFNQNVSNYQFYDVQAGPYLPHSIKAQTWVGANLTEETNISGQFISLTNNRWWYKRVSTTTKNYIDNSRTLTSFDYDTYGNTVFSLSRIGLDLSGNGPHQHQTEFMVEYGSYSSMMNPGKVTKNIEAQTRYGEPAVIKTTEYHYLNNGHLLEHCMEWPGTPKQRKTGYSFFGFAGIPTQQYVDVPGESIIYNKYNFDLQCRFAIEHINPLNQSSYTTYDEFSGLPLSKTAANGNNTSYTYDEFYRLKMATDIFGYTAIHTYHWGIMTGSGTSSTSVQNAWYYKDISKVGNAIQRTYYDILDRNRMNYTVQMSGPVVSVTSYKPFGGIATTTGPFNPNITSQAVITSHTYHPDLNLLTKTVQSNNSTSITTNYTYANSPGSNALAKHQRVTVSTPYGTSETIVDMLGKTTESHDDGGNLHFYYDSWGNTQRVSDGSQDHSTMTYDAYGRQASLQAFGAGTTYYEYNGLGRLVSQTDPANNIQSFVYDVTGRTVSETGPQGTTTYTYHTSGNGLNQIQSVMGFNGFARNYEYDQYSRLKKISYNASPNQCIYEYDLYGRMSKKSYTLDQNHQFDLEYEYNSSIGYLEKIKYDDGNSLTLLDAYSANQYGSLTDFKLGNGHTSDVEYNAFNMPTNYYTPTIQDLDLDWDVQTGNLDGRIDGYAGSGVTETFLYDNLQRLESSQVLNGSILLADINNVGDYTAKHDAGSEYTYYGKHLAKHVKNDNLEIPLATQSVSYNAFNEPEEILEGNYDITYTYGPNKNRMQSKIIDNGSTYNIETRNYLPELGYESVVKNGQINQMVYVPLTSNTMAIILKKDPLEGGGGTGGGGEIPGGEGGGGQESDWLNDCDIYFVYQDHIGSWLTVTGPTGAIVAEQNFDAWGRRRDPDTWQYVATNNEPEWLIRGYTGHEHFDEVGVIHMNGRLYDPVIGRMFSPDNFVQLPYNSQSYNRYAYAFNNPLKFTDPSGESVLILLCMVAFAAGSGAIIANSQGQLNGLSGRDLTMYTVGGAAIGAASALIGAGAGAAVATFGAAGFFAGAAAGGLAGGASGFVGGVGAAALSNRYLGTNQDVFKAGLVGAGLGAAGGALTGGLQGGAQAREQNANYFTGKSVTKSRPIDKLLWAKVDVEMGSNGIASDGSFENYGSFRLGSEGNGAGTMDSYVASQKGDITLNQLEVKAYPQIHDFNSGSNTYNINVDGSSYNINASGYSTNPTTHTISQSITLDSQISVGVTHNSAFSGSVTDGCGHISIRVQGTQTWVEPKPFFPLW